MYQRDKIRQWLDDGEGPQLDFKQSISSAWKIARTLVAFANSRGGKLVVGIEDKGFITGTNIDEQEYVLEKAAETYCKPPVYIEFETYEYDKKNLLIAYVDESDNKPHYAIDKKGREKIYVRIADECVVPSPKMERLLKSGDLNFLQRNTAYAQLKRDVITYLNTHDNISVDAYSQWKNIDIHYAYRTLTDLVLEGLLSTHDEIVYYLR